VSFAIPTRLVAIAVLGALWATSAPLSAARAGADPSSAGGAGPSQADAAPSNTADPECLTITQSSATTYLISNTACADQSVLTSIELATGDAAAAARCFTKKIRSQLSIASEQAPPVINYQCIEGTPGCTADILRGMFPECRAG